MMSKDQDARLTLRPTVSVKKRRPRLCKLKCFGSGCWLPGPASICQFPRSWRLGTSSGEDEEEEQGGMLRKFHSLVEPIRTASAL